ncbi:MAG TPA: 50S ribosomal protein L25 [Polyangia bacterium]|jgi:large subunit ribosomal protein L25|nr:50S ribosomal protein L25 [Polyangia bacterium]
MEVGKLNVEFRGDTGKTAVRRLRAAGKIPAIVYGGGGEPLALALDPSLLLKSLDPVKKTNTVLQLTVANAPAGANEITVMVRDYQKDAIRGNVTHADFIRVDMSKPVHATVPVVLVGKSEGVKLGGIMHQVIRVLAIACTPDKIPTKLEVDVTALGMNEALHVSDVKLGEGVRALADGGSTICAVTAPKAEKEVTPAAGAEGAAPAEGAAAAPAAAGKEGEKAAAGGDKKAAAPAKDAKK